MKNIQFFLYPRKQLDVGWRDLITAIFRCTIPRAARKSTQEIQRVFAPSESIHVAFSVRTSFDLCLQALSFPPGSEIIMSALTIREMADIARRHGLVPIPLDLNPETLSPEPSAFASAINPRTRALVIAHLFGARVPMEPFISIARQKGIFVFEDCAQAFTGPGYTGNPGTDAAMFSFGSIKTSTALGGALLLLRSAELRQKVERLQQDYPKQTSNEYFKEVFTHVCVKLFTLPLLFGLFYRACVVFGKDFERMINRVRNLPEGEEDFSAIRMQPSSTLVAMLARRLRTFDHERLMRRAQCGAEFARSLPNDILSLGQKAAFHSYWVFPVLVEAPGQLASRLRANGFDATSAGSALSVIEPPADRPASTPSNLLAAYHQILYLPVYPEIPFKARVRLQELLRQSLARTTHIEVTDARRVYSARVRRIETPCTISEIREALARTKREERSVCLLGTCHNLGSHAFIDDAVALDMRRLRRIVSLDAAGKRITVEAGITWELIQQVIAPHGLAMQAMQSDNNFTVGGSLASNGHGRDLHTSTIIQSVAGFRMMLADGSVVSASRTENSELFRLAIGGYGLFGIFLEVDLVLEKDCLFRQESTVMPLRVLPDYFEIHLRRDAAARFFIARPSIAPNRMLDETIVTVWRHCEARAEHLFRLDHERHVARDRFLFGLSRKYSWGRTIRWHAEKFLSLNPSNGGLVTRNNAMRPPVSAIKMFEYNSPRDTDVIQEFFVPIAKFVDFVAVARSIICQSNANLLGVTLRYVKQDAESFLSYASAGDAFAAVFYLNEALSPQGRTCGDGVIRKLIQAALDHGGTFYLTYVRDLNAEEIRQAYPSIDSFFQAKLRFDPGAQFMSRFYQHYRDKLQGA